MSALFMVSIVHVSTLLPNKHAIDQAIYYSNYATVVFMANHRFETGKKKVNHLTFADYSYCAVLMIANWSYSAIGRA